MSLARYWLRLLLAMIILLPTMLGCMARTIEKPPPTLSTESPIYFPQSPEKDVDLLFMVDNSNSMDPAQDNLQRNFPRFIEALRSHKLGALPGKTCTPQDTSGCKIPNVRIGVVTSDMGAGPYSFQTCETPGGDGGRLKNTRGALAPIGCPTPSNPWIEYSENAKGVISTNVQGAKSSDPVEQVKEAFSCIAPIGTGGCGFEQQLESVRRALDGCQFPSAACKTNPSFIRPDAYLAVVFITNEDDCSARRGDLFDPTQQGLNDPLGPLNSFRCTEFGLLCSEKLRQPGLKHNCVPGLDYLHPIDTYVQFLTDLKPPGRVILFTLAGPTQPVEVGLDGVNPALKASCSSAPGGHGDPAIRLASVVKSFGTKGHFNEGIVGDKKVEVNICSADFSPALQLLGEVIVGPLGPQCIPAPITGNGAVACQAGDALGPGVTCSSSCLDKTECAVEEQVNMGPRRVVNKCPAELFDPAIKQNACGANCDCWRIVPNALCKPGKNGSPYALEIMREGDAKKGTMAIVHCATTTLEWGSTEFAKLPQCR